MNPESKEKQPPAADRLGPSIIEVEEKETMFTDCSIPFSKRGDTQNKQMVKLGEPFTVVTSKPDSRQSTLWKLDCNIGYLELDTILGDSTYWPAKQYDKPLPLGYALEKFYSALYHQYNTDATIKPMRNWQPKVTCLALCKCYPAQALQVYELAISCTKHNEMSCQAYISGFFAIRDYYDKHRIYIFKHEMSLMEITNGFGKVRITTPSRGILYGDLVFDYDLNIKYQTVEGYKEENIKGQSLYKGGKCPYSGHTKIIQASIPVDSDTEIYSNMDIKVSKINLMFVRFAQGIEAEIEIEPPEGFYFRLTARMGNVAYDIVLFDGEYMPNGTFDHGSLKFVLVVPFLDILELEFTRPNIEDEQPKIYAFKSFYHGISSKDVSFGSSMIKMKVTWSRM